MENMLEQLFQKVYKGSMDEFMKVQKSLWAQGEKNFIVTANPEIFSLALIEAPYGEILTHEQTTIVADGIGVVKGAGYLGYEVAERLPGVELTVALLTALNEKKGSLAMVGAREEVLKDLIQSMEKTYPQVQVVYADNGYDFQPSLFLEAVKEKAPDLILAALGAPKQEQILWEAYQVAKQGIFMGVGGSFDVLSGHKKRAPKVFIQLKLEWAYRILKEPKRFSRFFKSNLRFLRGLQKTKKHLRRNGAEV